MHKPGLFRETASVEKRSLKELSAGAAEKAGEGGLFCGTLEEVNWNRKQAARQLNICYKSLLNKLRRWQLGSRVEADDVDETETVQVAHAGEASF